MNQIDNNQAGKGDMPRPISLSKYQKNYELVFGSNKKPKELEILNAPQTPIIMDPENEAKQDQ